MLISSAVSSLWPSPYKLFGGEHNLLYKVKLGEFLHNFSFCSKFFSIDYLKNNGIRYVNFFRCFRFLLFPTITRVVTGLHIKCLMCQECIL